MTDKKDDGVRGGSVETNAISVTEGEIDDMVRLLKGGGSILANKFVINTNDGSEIVIQANNAWTHIEVQNKQ